MQKRTVQRGRPAGSTTHDAELAHAFGAAVRALRMERGIAQESLAHQAGIERSHMGKIERGEHMPTLAIIFKIAGALECSTAVLMSEAESQLAAAAPP
ncbi:MULTISPECIES: helix-turn-helix domain-containing protein [Pseudomonadota]|jgi:XRE family transcriptional regulator, regulator of sulfur utilization|uniref:Transcriptional regulator, XRE family n=10 Tax=Pseudomonadota TaxID=1224 RepID=A9BR49_DELAS|nr:MULTISPECIES: helix-turn-helix transcriptional regulator [Pseudomonadota]KAA9176127.1 helix-turn-helix transcriptional regulator [Delftia sp. BR1]OLE95789.1 MAG: transcriptional regulator [Delftia sp. 13_1_40CM_3_66_6]PZQ72771.1 MAG: XRE family transcriptional regulator [Variovorax paradoxus]ABX33107.1 transcriptional regulator, XRE family [Delftia acidovorans SPH-1]AOV03003.1 transcriptional regulator [Delftia tsuruhatensis]